ncbi:MAG TPA: NADH-quinone oxidoreductase subunit N [Acidimicrobiia bacterium]|nr:NADH-quinone oxidoreductase subunit N [Acidimicrobiia bacterium]
MAAVEPIATPSVNWLAIAPEIALAGAAVLIVLLRAMLRRRPGSTASAFVVAVAGVLAAGGTLAWQWLDVRDHGPITTMAGMVRVDGFGVYLGIIVVIATALALLVSIAYLRREGLEAPEYLALMLFSALGMLIMTTANNLIVVFLALEVLSIPLYVLAAFDRRRLSSQEAGIKYFVLGSFSSAIFLYGIALVYGATGTTSLTGISRFLAQNTLFDTGTLLAGFALLLVGLGFKVAAAPFHTWTPDVYQGAPTPITAFMSSATKTAGFAGLLRVFLIAFPLYRSDWRPAVWVLAVLTLAVGSVGAALQTDVKRLLAYSSIAHAGYVLIGFQAATPRGREAALFYLFVYTFMVVGSFAIVTVLSITGDDDHSIDGYRGLAFRRPVLGTLFIFFLLAQAGIPLTGGFIAKLEVFQAATDAGEYALVAIGAVATVVATFAYLRVALAVARPESDEQAVVRDPRVPLGRRVDVWTGVVLTATAAMTLLLGVLPSVFVDWAHHAGSML